MIRAFTHTPPSRGKITGFAVLISSRRSSINVVFVVVWHGSLVIVTVVVYVVVRLGSWHIFTSHPLASLAGTTAPSAMRAKISFALIHQLARRPQVQ